MRTLKLEFHDAKPTIKIFCLEESEALYSPNPILGWTKPTSSWAWFYMSKSLFAKPYIWVLATGLEGPATRKPETLLKT